MELIDKTLIFTLNEIEKCDDIKQLQELRSASIGKNGKLSDVFKRLKDCNESDKKNIGTIVNKAKQEIISAIQKKEKEILCAEMVKKLHEEFIDVTMPGRMVGKGKVHPLTKTKEEVYEILSGLGFSFADGPDIETDYFNFTALNIPEHHPARTMHDTFYVSAISDSKLLLRTHTSPVQIRSLTDKGAPIRVFSIGRTYRSDSDATHTPMFHQIEGLVVDENINFSHLKWTIIEFFKRFFDVEELNIRLRPSFFPFTEPSAEIDMAYSKEKGKIKFGVGENWLEMGGCGMIHPNVLKNCGIDYSKYQGFAFGMGLERITSLKYGIPDLRQYFEYDTCFADEFYFDQFVR